MRSGYVLYRTDSRDSDTVKRDNSDMAVLLVSTHSHTDLLCCSNYRTRKKLIKKTFV